MTAPASPQPATMPQEIAIGLPILFIIAMLGLIVFGIHAQIPNQQYCDDVLKHRHDTPFSSVMYLESLNQSKCIYNDSGAFVYNPKFSIWGLRV